MNDATNSSAIASYLQARGWKTADCEDLVFRRSSALNWIGAVCVHLLFRIPRGGRRMSRTGERLESDLDAWLCRKIVLNTGHGQEVEVLAFRRCDRDMLKRSEIATSLEKPDWHYLASFDGLATCVLLLVFWGCLVAFLCWDVASLFRKTFEQI